MDVLEIMTTLRNIKGLEDEDSISSREMLRAINMGYRTLLKKLKAELRPYFSLQDYTETLAGDSIFYYPEDFCEVRNIKRGSYLCAIVDPEVRSLIGNNPNYPSDPLMPYAVDFGKYAEIYPLPTSTAIDMDYLRFPPDLLFGTGTINVSSELVLADGKNIDDYYNKTHLSIYQRSEASIAHIGKDRITDYDGSSLTATLNSLASKTGIIYASEPLIPEEYQRYLSDFAILEMAKTGHADKNVAQLAADVINNQLKPKAA